MNTTETEFDLYYDRYFDDIEGHIEMLNIELSITEDDSEHADDLRARIAYLEERAAAGDAFVANDESSFTWNSLPTYSEQEAREKFHEWWDN